MHSSIKSILKIFKEKKNMEKFYISDLTAQLKLLEQQQQKSKLTQEKQTPGNKQIECRNQQNKNKERNTKSQ